MHRVPTRPEVTRPPGGGPPVALGPDTSCKSGPLSPDKIGSSKCKCKSGVASHSLLALQRCLQLARQESHQPTAGVHQAAASPVRPRTVAKVPKVIHTLHANA